MEPMKHKLELKHLSPYLPYGLKAIDLENGSIREVTLLHFTYDLATVGHNHLLYEGLLLKKTQTNIKTFKRFVRLYRMGRINF